MPGTWTFFQNAKGSLGKAVFNFSTAGAFKVTFHTSTTALSATSNVSTMAQLSTLAPRHVSTNNLSLAGFTLSSNAWVTSGSGYKFCANGVCVSANGGAFNNLKYIVMRLSAGDASSGRPIAYAQLTTSGAITIAAGSAIKINGGSTSPTATTIFTLS